MHLKDLEVLFQHKVLKMLLKRGKISKDLISMLLSWRHSGFNVYCGKRIYSGDEAAMENLARYIILTFNYHCKPTKTQNQALHDKNRYRVFHKICRDLHLVVVDFLAFGK